MDPHTSVQTGIEPLLLFGACVLLCAAPAAVCYLFSNRHAGTLFYLLVIPGALYFPMGLLAVGVYESIDALNPVPIVK